MKNKKSALLAGLLGAGVLVASAKYYLDVQEEQAKKVALQQVRDYFADFGVIATVFVDESQSDKDVLIGGVVMEEGPVYLFENRHGQLQYEEENNEKTSNL